jgi:hypothetical protein
MVTFSPQTHQACGAGSGASECRVLHSPMPTSIFAARASFRRGAARITQASRTRAAISAAGEEATIVGLTSVMRPDDYLIGTYRTPGHAIARGTDPRTRWRENFTDVWQSREQFEKFAQEEIGPRTQEVGFPGPPEITFHDVHNHLTAG